MLKNNGAESFKIKTMRLVVNSSNFGAWLQTRHSISDMIWANTGTLLSMGGEMSPLTGQRRAASEGVRIVVILDTIKSHGFEGVHCDSLIGSLQRERLCRTFLKVMNVSTFPARPCIPFLSNETDLSALACSPCSSQWLISSSQWCRFLDELHGSLQMAHMYLWNLLTLMERPGTSLQEWGF